MKRLTDPTFRYIPSHKTRIQDTFKRIRREQETAKLRDAEIAAEQSRVVRKLGGRNE